MDEIILIPINILNENNSIDEVNLTSKIEKTISSDSNQSNLSSNSTEEDPINDNLELNSSRTSSNEILNQNDIILNDINHVLNQINNDLNENHIIINNNNPNNFIQNNNPIINENNSVLNEANGNNDIINENNDIINENNDIINENDKNLVYNEKIDKQENLGSLNQNENNNIENNFNRYIVPERDSFFLNSDIKENRKKIESIEKNIKQNKIDKLHLDNSLEEISEITERYKYINENIINNYSEDDESNSRFVFKVLVVGDTGYGKTSIVQTLCTGAFTTDYRATVGVDFALKEIKIGKKNITFQLWDIGGYEKFGSLTRYYYKSAVGAFIVMDITQSSSLNTIEAWKRDLEEKVKLNANEDIPTILLINKVDMGKSFIDEKSIMNLCSELNIREYFYTSAKENIGIDIALLRMAVQIMKHSSFQSYDLFQGYKSNSISLTIENNQQITNKSENSTKCCSFS